MSTKAATSLSLAVNELLTNAAKHNKRNGRKGETSHDAIEVRLQRQNDTILVAVAGLRPGVSAGVGSRSPMPISDSNSSLPWWNTISVAPRLSRTISIRERVCSLLEDGSRSSSPSSPFPSEREAGEPPEAVAPLTGKTVVIVRMKG